MKGSTEAVARLTQLNGIVYIDPVLIYDQKRLNFYRGDSFFK